VPWPGRRSLASADAPSVAARRPRRRLSPVRRWLPTVLVGLVFGGVVFLFATLRFLAQAPETAQSAPAPVVEVIQSAPAPEVAGPPPPTAPNESVTRQGGITFTARQIEPTYTVVSGDSLSAIAQRYGTTAEALQGINNLPDTMLHVGQKLVLP